MTKVDINGNEPSRFYLISNEVFNAVTHGIGFGLSIAGLVVLLVSGARSGEAIRVVSYAIYGSSLILLYLFSTLYHSLAFTPAKKLFKIFDHSGIYVLIAGTYTPLCLLTIGGAAGWALFGTIWGLAVAGVVYKCLFIGKHRTVSTLIYVLMGWLCIIFIKPIYAGLGAQGFGLLLAGGLAFTIGAVFYSFRNIKYIHVVWHFFVLLGTILMYFSILFYA